MKKNRHILLLCPDRTLTETETYYQEKFIELIKDNDIAKNIARYDEERFKQCLDTERDGIYYNPSWFVSDYGRILSVKENSLKQLTPSIKVGGVRNKNEPTTSDRWNDYTKSRIKRWKEHMEKGYVPKYFYYQNDYTGRERIVVMHRIVAFYFMPDDIRKKVVTERKVVHHKMFDWSQDPLISGCNHISNLQVLKQDTHNKMHSALKKIDKTFKNAEAEEKEGRYVATSLSDDITKRYIINGAGTSDMYLLIPEHEDEVTGKVLPRRIEYHKGA